MKIDKNSSYLQTKTSYILSDSGNFNQVFRKDVTYDNIKSHKKVAFRSPFRRYIFEKTAGGHQPF